MKWFPSYDAVHNRWLVVMTLLVGLLLDSISWPRPWGLAIPDLTPLILLYWVMALANSNFLLTAFIFGMLHDVLYHTGLGTYALIYLLMVYLMLHLRLQLRNKTLIHMSLFLALWMLGHQLLAWLLTPSSLTGGSHLAYWLAAATTLLIWPPLFQLLRAIRRSARIY